MKTAGIVSNSLPYLIEGAGTAALSSADAFYNVLMQKLFNSKLLINK